MKKKINQQRVFKGPWPAQNSFASGNVVYTIGVLVLFAIYLCTTISFFYGALHQSTQTSTTPEYYDVDAEQIHRRIRDCKIPPEADSFSISPVAAQQTVTGLPAHKMVLTIKAIYNEEDILQELLLWYLDQGFRRFSMLDTGSTDGTMEIISNFREDYQHIAEIVLIVFRKFSNKVDNFESMIFLFSTQLWPDAPWIFVVDTDEFVVSNNGLLQDFGSIPKDKDALLCKIDQYCPLQNYTVKDDTNFYRKNQHLLKVSRKQKCIGRPNFFYKIKKGHHNIEMLEISRCAKEYQENDQLLSELTQNLTSQQKDCRSRLEELQIGHDHECLLEGISIINLPENSKILQQGVELQSAFEDISVILPNKNLVSYVNAVQGIYSMFEAFVKSGRCNLDYTIKWDLYSVFYPPIKRPVNSNMSNITLLELQHEFYSYMKAYEMGSNDMVLLILHTNPGIDLTNSIKWHFSLGFRRFFILSTFKYDNNQRAIVDEVSKKLGKFAGIATIELQKYFNYKREGLLEVISQFITYSQIWQAPTSLLSFIILDHQILISESASVYQTVVDANERQNCKVYSTGVTDCTHKYFFQSITQSKSDCVNLNGIISHQALRFNQNNYLNVQFSPAQYQNKPQANFFSIQSNLERFVDKISSYRYLTEPNYASCRDYNISFREYPIRSKSHFIRKFSSGGPWKYSQFRKSIARYKDKDLVYEYVYKATRTATSNGVYDPLPIDKAINNTKNLKKNTYFWRLQ